MITAAHYNAGMAARVKLTHITYHTHTVIRILVSLVIRELDYSTHINSNSVTHNTVRYSLNHMKQQNNSEKHADIPKTPHTCHVRIY